MVRRVTERASGLMPVQTSGQVSRRISERMPDHASDHVSGRRSRLCSKQASKRSTQRQRLMRACTYIAVLVVMFGVISFACSANAGTAQGSDGNLAIGRDDVFLTSHSDTTYIGDLWEQLKNGVSEKDALVSMGFTAGSVDKNEIPSWFFEEIAVLPSDAMLVMDDAETLAQFTVKGRSDQVADDLEEGLLSRGWLKYERKEDSGGKGFCQDTYSKEGGYCSWLMVSIQQVGEEASVVMHIQHV